MTTYEPLKLTLEEAMLRLDAAGGLWLHPYPEGWSVLAWDDVVDGIAWVGFGGTWPEAVSQALGRPVAARDEAAELRAALREPYGNLEVLVNLWTEIGYIPNRKDNLHPPLEELQDVLKGFRAALAASEGQP